MKSQGIVETHKEQLKELLDYIMDKGYFTADDIQKAKLMFARNYRWGNLPRNSELISLIEKDDKYVDILKKKPTRTLSGSTPVAVMTSPADCPHGKCIFCPGGTDNNSPQSYTGYEPAAMRGKNNDYDPFMQVTTRIEQYESIGHPSDKVDIIVMGGTFISRNKEYTDYFIKGIYDGLNGTVSESLKKAINMNEVAVHRCIGMTMETRPDYSFEEHIKKMVSYGTTRVEIGVQSVYNDVLSFVKRGHTVEDSIKATQLLKDAGLKVSYHMMPGLPGVDRERDIASLIKIIEEESFMPDMVKIYPLLVMKGTVLYEMWQRKEYIPPDIDDIVSIIAEFKSKVPPWLRIQRIQRDIPSNLIDVGIKKSNLRQIVGEYMKANNMQCNCIRCREAGRRATHGEIKIKTVEYDASKGKEFFISFEDDSSLHAYVRLRFPYHTFMPEHDEDTALIRELRVVGVSAPIGKQGIIQHKGLGSKLMEEAERISKSYGYRNISVTSGVGVREYYRKLGYSLKGNYMIKELK